jgi:hypothetical protein
MTDPRDLLPGFRFLKWRALAAAGYDPYAINRSIPLRRGFRDAVVLSRWYRKETT